MSASPKAIPIGVQNQWLAVTLGPTAEPVEGASTHCYFGFDRRSIAPPLHLSKIAVDSLVFGKQNEPTGRFSDKDVS
jgi:hypothetical protein